MYNRQQKLERVWIERKEIKAQDAIDKKKNSGVLT